jgi:KDO2-lipid IV(A) lauroyltransferase
MPASLAHSALLLASRKQSSGFRGEGRPIHSDDSAVGDSENVSLWRFWRPRYWATWVFVAWLRLTAMLPWRFAVKLHKHLGRFSGRLQRRRRTIVRRNLETCFPHLTAPEVETLCAQHFENVGAFFAEVAISWFGDMRRMADFVRIEGGEHLDAAIARGKGVLLFSGHFTTLEMCVPMVRDLVPLYAFMFRRRSNPLLNEIQRRCRVRAAHASVGSDDVRSLLRMLRKNATVWYAPDQVRVKTGVLVPFFGEPAMTSTAASRLARVSGVAVIPFFFCRSADDSGYLLRFYPQLDDFPTTDEIHDTARLMSILEGFVRECPAQYFWTHKKFKGRPSEMRDLYGSSST